MIVRAAARMPENYVEFFVATNNLASLTGLLAELGGELSRKVEGPDPSSKNLSPVTDDKIKEILEKTRALLSKFDSVESEQEKK